MSGKMCFATHVGRQVVSTQLSCWKVESASHYFTHTTWWPSQWPLLKLTCSKFHVFFMKCSCPVVWLVQPDNHCHDPCISYLSLNVPSMRRICPHDNSICRVDTTCPLIWVVKHYFSPGITGLKITKILRSPVGDQMEKYSRQI